MQHMCHFQVAVSLSGSCGSVKNSVTMFCQVAVLVTSNCVTVRYDSNFPVAVLTVDRHVTVRQLCYCLVAVSLEQTCDCQEAMSLQVVTSLSSSCHIH